MLGLIFQDVLELKKKVAIKLALTLIVDILYFLQYCPDLVIVSAGFDAARGDPLVSDLHYCSAFEVLFRDCL